MAAEPHPGGPTVAAVRERLDRVTDPELDESIVALDYVDEVSVDGRRVTVRFTLPTAWCSPAFAWMMATDARDEVESLPGVDEATVVLRDHMHETEVNEGVAERTSFAEAFPDADDGVTDLRATLDDKARLSRQHLAVDALREAGLDAEAIVALERGDVDLDFDRKDGGAAGVETPDDARAAVSLADDAVRVTVPREPLARYCRKAAETGHVTDPGDRLFRTPEGDPIAPEEFDLVRKRTRLARTNMSGQGGLCDALNEARRIRLDRDESV